MYQRIRPTVRSFIADLNRRETEKAMSQIKDKMLEHYLGRIKNLYSAT